MFNEETKRRFIAERNDEVILPVNYLIREFNEVAAIEEKLQKDLCDFTLYEIKEYYKMLNTSSVNRLQVLTSQFSTYTQWCLQQNLVKDNQNHFLELKGGYNDCINVALLNEKIVSRETVLKWANECINAKDAFILLALFEGICGKEFCEIVNLRPEDVNGNIATLCDGRSIEISKELISLIDKCVEEDTYYGKEDDNRVQKVYKLIDNGYVVKDFPNIKLSVDEFYRGRRVYYSIKRSMKDQGKENIIRSSNIVESGKIDMIKKRSLELGMSAVDYIYSKNITEVEKKYGCRIYPSSYIIKYRNYLE